MGVALCYGVLCHAMFAAGVGCMIAAMYFGMSRSLGAVAPPWNCLANALLVLQFPLAHSFLLTRPGQRVLAAVAPAAHGTILATTTYALIASLQIFLLFAFWSPTGIVWWRASGWSLWLATALYAGSWLLLLKSLIDAGVQLQIGLLGWWALLKNARPVFPDMPTRGLFRMVRQPIYLAFALTLWSVPTWTPDQLVVAVALTCYCLIGPLLKERRFLRRFGARFQAYRAITPYWLPVFWQRPRPDANDLAIYDAAATGWWDETIPWVRVLRTMVPGRMRHFDAIVGDWKGLEVLDLGCAGGFMSEAMAERGAHVTGIDPAPLAIEAARRHAAGRRLAIRYDVGCGENLPYETASFDIVLCVDVLEHVADLNAVLRELRRVLRPDGIFLFDTINRTWLASCAMVAVAENWLGLLPKGTHDPARFIRPAELRCALANVGMQAGAFSGFGPQGFCKNRSLHFGWLPTKAVIYIGHARLKNAPGLQPPYFAGCPAPAKR